MSAIESWFAPAAIAEPLATPPPRKGASAPARSKPQRRQRRSLRVRASLVWMVIFAVLLVGVVAVNVAGLRAHVSVNDLDQRITELQQQNATLESEYSSVTAAPRIEAAAGKAGEQPATSVNTTLIDMGRGK